MSIKKAYLPEPGDLVRLTKRRRRGYMSIQKDNAFGDDSFPVGGGEVVLFIENIRDEKEMFPDSWDRILCGEKIIFIAQDWPRNNDWEKVEPQNEVQSHE